MSAEAAPWPLEDDDEAEAAPDEDEEYFKAEEAPDEEYCLNSYTGKEEEDEEDN